MKITFLFRSKNLKFFSIENVFNSIQRQIANKVEIENVFLPSPGINFRNLFFLIKKKGVHTADLFHVTGDIHFAVFFYPKKHTVLTIHDCVFVHKNKGIKKWVLKKLFLDWPVAYATYITAISEKTKEEIIALTGCKSNKIQVIPNPVSDEFQYKAKKFNTQNPNLLFIGTTPNKNLDRVIEAIRNFSCSIDIIGSPTIEQINFLQSCKIQYSLYNSLSLKQMVEKFENCDIIVFPSLYEGFGLPIIEGFKTGRPVLTSNISPMREIAAGAAWLVDPLNVDSIKIALSNIVINESERENKIKAGLAIAEKYSETAIANQYFNLYKKLKINLSKSIL